MGSALCQRTATCGQSLLRCCGVVQHAIEPQEFKRRVNAAMALAGIRGRKVLARKLNQHRLSYSNMRLMDRGDTLIYRSDLYAIAEACGLSVDWFYADLTRLAEIPLAKDGAKTRGLDPGEDLEQELAEGAALTDTQIDSSAEAEAGQGGRA